MVKSKYDKIVKYNIKAVCKEPLHIGSASGEKGDILIHPVENVPFIQATSIAGVFREYFSRTYPQIVKELFGSPDKESDYRGSKIIFSDAKFDLDTLKMELRPRVKINQITGTAMSSKLKGIDAESGQKFEMECVAAGSHIAFQIVIKEKDEFYETFLEESFMAIENGDIQFGGQKSNGCGYLSFVKIEKDIYEMEKQEDYLAWIKNQVSANHQDVLHMLETDKKERYQLILNGETEGSLLVKGIAVTGQTEKLPDAMNIRNGAGDFIVPASSVKGSVRSQISKILDYLQIDTITLDRIFGKNAEGTEKGNLGVIRCFDMMVGSQKENEKAKQQTRIHVDKFTGGVFDGGLFSDQSVHGNFSMKIEVLQAKKEEVTSKRTCAILLMVLRDFAKGQLALGSGYNIGRGFLKGKEILLCTPNGKQAKIILDTGKIEGKEVIDELWSCL